MAEMGIYCKAYYLAQFREFKGWREDAQNATLEGCTLEGKEVQAPRRLESQSILYLHENYFVTDGVFLDENIIFKDVTPDWQDFCREQLGFAIPEDIVCPGSQDC